MYHYDHDGKETGARRSTLPMALFFVSVFAAALAARESLGGGRRLLTAFMGPVPVLLVLLGFSAVGAVWFLRGGVKGPFRKVLALMVAALPLAGLLGQFGDSTEAFTSGGIAGRNLSLALGFLPSVMAAGLAVILLLFACVLAWKLAFDPMAGQQHPAAALAQALEGKPSSSTAVLARPAPPPDAYVPDHLPEDIGTEDSYEDDSDFEGALDLDEAEERITAQADVSLIVGPELDVSPDPEMVPRTSPETEIPIAIETSSVTEELETPSAEEFEEVEEPSLEAPAYLAAVSAWADEDEEVQEVEDRYAGIEEDVVPRGLVIPLSEEEEPETPKAVVRTLPSREDADVVDEEDELPAGFIVGYGDEDADEKEDDEKEDDEKEDDEKEDDEEEDDDYEDDEEEEDDEEDDEEEEEDEEEEDADDDEDEEDDEDDDDEDDEEEEEEEDDESGELTDDEEALEEEDEELPVPSESTQGAERTTPGNSDSGPRVVWGPRSTSSAPTRRAGGTAGLDKATSASFDPEEAVESGATPAKGAGARRSNAPHRGSVTPLRGHPIMPAPTQGSAARDEEQSLLFSHREALDAGLYQRAVDLVLAEDRCSVTMLQRNLSVSFSDATTLIERMHESGVVGPQLPSGRRQILKRDREDHHPAEA